MPEATEVAEIHISDLPAEMGRGWFEEVKAAGKFVRNEYGKDDKEGRMGFVFGYTYSGKDNSQSNLRDAAILFSQERRYPVEVWVMWRGVSQRDKTISVEQRQWPVQRYMYDTKEGWILEEGRTARFDPVEGEFKFDMDLMADPVDMGRIKTRKLEKSEVLALASVWSRPESTSGVISSEEG